MAGQGTDTAGRDASTGSTSEAQGAPSGYVSYSKYSEDRAKYADSDVVLFFNASWCPTCIEADRNLSDASFPDGLVVVSVDYDENTDLRQEYGVTTQHTYVQVDSTGGEVTKFTGANNVDEIERQLA